jgi:4-aminobutyrate aminotransferase
LPISGVAAKKHIMDKWSPGTHGGTYGGGSAVPLAAAVATIETLVEEKIPDNAAKMGERLMDGLIKLQQEFSVIGEVRGLGLMVGTEFTDATGQPDKDTCKAVQKACLEQNLMLLTCGTYENIIRWIPPLVVNAQQIDEALGIFRSALEKSVKTAVAAD